MRKAIVAVTGASAGIGCEIARDLSAHGATVYACSRTAIPPMHGVIAARVDLRDPVAVHNWAATVKSDVEYVDMLVNNAAIVGERAPFHQISHDVWSDALNTNLLGTVAVTRAMLPLLKNAAPATIVNVGSIMGRFGRAGWSPYVATKFAVEGLSQVLAQEFFRLGIRVVTLHPARINTRLRKHAYGEEELFAIEHLTSILDALRWMLAHPFEPLSGLTLSSDDFATWSGE